MARWLKKRGPGLHHVMFDVDGLPSALQALKERGIGFLGGMEERPHQLQAFIDPEQSHGGLIELGESRGRSGPVRARPGRPTFDHMGWAVTDMEGARSFFRLLDFEVGSTGPDTAVFACDHASIKSSPCGISLKAPSGEGPFSRYVAKHGPGIHHIMFAVCDLAKTAQALRKAGFRLTPEEPIPESHQQTWFVHPKDLQGILVELGQPREIIPNR